MSKFRKNDPRTKELAKRGGLSPKLETPIKKIKQGINFFKDNHINELSILFEKYYTKMSINNLKKEMTKDLTPMELMVGNAIIKSSETGDIRYIQMLYLYTIGKPREQEQEPIKDIRKNCRPIEFVEVKTNEYMEEQIIL